MKIKFTAREVFFYLLLIILVVQTASCKKEPVQVTIPPSSANRPPVANAGMDQTINIQDITVTLDGSGSTDPDNNISIYAWTKISGPSSFNIANAGAVQTPVTNLVLGIYQFELKITDAGGLFSKDTVQVTVSTSVQPNRPPVANAGTDQTITLPTNSVTLDGRGSADPDNNIISYAWTKISGPLPSNIVNPISAQTTLAGLVHGTYQFELNVTDGGGLFSKDTVVITVNSNPANSSHWTQLAFLPADEFFFAPRFWFGGSNFFMGINDKVFAVSNKGGLWQYNMQTNNWSKIGAFPEQMNSAPAVFAINGKGYCIGNGHCWQYDPVANQWTRKNDPPDNYGLPFLVLVVNAKAYLVHGTVFVYDPSADTYTQKNNFTGGAETGFVINNEGYCIADGRCWKYDVVNDNWQQRATLPASVIWNMTGFALNNSGYILGDLNLNTYNLNYPMKVWRYDPLLNQWNQFEEDYPGYGAYGINAVSLNGIVYAGIGYNNGDFNAIDFWKFQ